MSCLICKKKHDKIYHKFTSYITPHKITKNDSKEFINLIKFELEQKNWNGVFCLVENILKQKIFYFDSNPFSNSIYYSCVLLYESLTKSPNENSLKKIEELNNQFEKIEFEENMPNRIKGELTFEEIDKELKSVYQTIRFIEVIDNQSTDLSGINIDSIDLKQVEKSLKNYAIFRLISIYERWIYEIIAKEIDKIHPDSLRYVLGSEVKINTDDLRNFENISIGELGAQSLNNSPSALNSIIVKILKAQIKGVYDDFSFFKFLDKYLRINDSNMKKELEKTRGWIGFIKSMNLRRNSLTHDLGNTQMTLDEIKDVVSLYYLFMKLFPILLSCMKNLDKTINSELENKLGYSKLFEDVKRQSDYELPEFNELMKIIRKNVLYRRK